MQTTRDLFSGYTTTTTAQSGLYDDAPGVLGAHCPECGLALVQTPTGYLCCPAGHGRLMTEAPPDVEPCGSWFDPDPVDLARWENEGGR